MEKDCFIEFYNFIRSPHTNKIYKHLFALVFYIILFGGGVLLYSAFMSLTDDFFYPDSRIVNMPAVCKICISTSIMGIFWAWLSSFFNRTSWKIVNIKSVCYSTPKALKAYLDNAQMQAFFYLLALGGIVALHAMVIALIYKNLNFLNTANILVEYKCVALFLLSLLAEISFILWRIGVIYKMSMIKLAFPEKNIYEDWDQIQKIINSK